jgi:predicted nuclease of predicted toxin-antitoxin system
VILWLDAHISPKLCAWIRREFAVQATHVRDLGLRGAEDPEIFAKARAASAVVLSKDEDFVVLVERLGPPPKVIWLTCGNAPNARLKRILTDALPEAIAMLERSEAVVEISKTEGPVNKRARLTRRSKRRRRTRRA